MSDQKNNVVSTVVTQQRSNVLVQKAEIVGDSTQHAEITNEQLSQGLTGGQLLHPQYSYATLRSIISESSTLPVCFEAVETNVASTGFMVLESDKETEDEGTSVDKMSPEQKKAYGFFGELWPGVDLVDLLRATVNEVESVGLYYWEVFRNANKEIAFCRGVSADNLRPLRFGPADKVVKEVTLNRLDTDFKIDNFETFERRYVKTTRLAVGTKDTTSDRVYYREFGSSRDLDRLTGEWATAAKPVAVENLATELIEFKRNKAGSPVWITDLQFVLGEREAGSMNLEFFGNGGVPPAIIALIGGQLTNDSRDRFNAVLTGKAKDKLAVALVEVFSTGGSLDGKDVPAKLEVHKFGAESANDVMFEKYLKLCSERIRRRWRLPAILTGDASDMSYATAFVSYMVAEEQVFAPMRKTYYSIINSTLMKDKSLGGGALKLSPKALTIKDSKQLQTALDNALAKGAIDKTEYRRQLNLLLNLNLVEPKEVDAVPGEAGEVDEDGNPVNTDDPAGADNSRTDVGTLNQQGTNTEAPRNSQKADSTTVDFVLTLAEDVAKCLLSGAPVTEEVVQKMEELSSIDGATAVFKRCLVSAVLTRDTGTGAADLVAEVSNGCCGN